MRTLVVEIDAKKAKGYLENNDAFGSDLVETNRQISLYRVNKYALSMLKGEWRLTHQGIGFDVNGKLKDGQHRLMAIIQAAEVGAYLGSEKIDPNPNIKIPFNVTHGLDPDVFSVLDTGYNRNAGHILSMSGYTGAVQLAACARLLYLYKNYKFTDWRRASVTNQEILDYTIKYDLEKCLDKAKGLKGIGFIVSSATAGYTICEEAYPNGPHDEFINSIVLGGNLDDDDPRLALRNSIIRSKTLKSGTRKTPLQITHFAWYVKVWNDFVNGRRRNVIAWRPSHENFPLPVER